nr:sirtuin-3-like protein [Dugesia japonica]
MLNAMITFFKVQNFIILMSKTNTNPPINLLNRLKIVHSTSVQSNKTTNPFGQKPITSSQNLSAKVGITQNNFNKIPRQTSLNRNFLLRENTAIISNKIVKPKVPSRNYNRTSSVSLSESSSRPFSTFGRYFSTPSGTDDKKFILDICQKIFMSKIKNIVVMAGAGISCPSGIPDFRSPGTGLYDNLKQYKIPYPEAIFDIDYFLSNPKPFFTLAKELFPSGKYRPNKVHYFFRLLQEKKLLRRIYTQNIDGLERLAGLSDSNLVEAHGTFASASCVSCGECYSPTQLKESIDKNEICYCSNCRGIVKPDIVFFGEDLPSKFHLYRSDFQQADLLLVMGTSLEVEPFASIVDSTKFGTPRILLNRDAVGVFRSKRRVHDNCILGDIIDGIDILVKNLRWENELDKLIKEGEEKPIDFLSTISKIKRISNPNTRNFSTFVNVRRSRPWVLPPLQSNSKNLSKARNLVNDSSSEEISDDSSSSFDSDSS